MHVDRDDLSAKFWLEPLALVENHGFSRKELREIEDILKKDMETLKNAWDNFCNDA